MKALEPRVNRPLNPMTKLRPKRAIAHPIRETERKRV